MKIKLSFELTNNDESISLLAVNGVTNIDMNIPEYTEISEELEGSDVYVAAVEVILDRIIPHLQSPALN